MGGGVFVGAGAIGAISARLKSGISRAEIKAHACLVFIRAVRMPVIGPRISYISPSIRVCRKEK